MEGKISMKKKFCFVMLVALSMCLGACNVDRNNDSQNTDDISEVNEDVYEIYLLYKTSGGTMTYEEWLASIKGADGFSLLNGTTDPTLLIGNNGDTYINTTSWDVFVKNGGVWSKVGNILGQQGPKGDQGDSGQDGSDGRDGVDGTSVLTGNGIPTFTLGKEGDCYIDLLTWDFYVKESSVWNLKGNIKGQNSNYADENGFIYTLIPGKGYLITGFAKLSSFIELPSSYQNVSVVGFSEDFLINNPYKVYYPSEWYQWRDSFKSNGYVIVPSTYSYIGNFENVVPDKIYFEGSKQTTENLILNGGNSSYTLGSSNWSNHAKYLYSCVHFDYQWMRENGQIVTAIQNRVLIETKDSTETEEGYNLYKCSKCNEEYRENIPLKEHLLSVWDGTSSEPTQTETIDNVLYYKINNASEFAYLKTCPGEWLSHNFILKCDVKINDEDLAFDDEGNLKNDTSDLNSWDGISDFSGIFDGNGMNIFNAYMTGSGLFNVVTNGNIKNINVVNSYISGTSNIGGVAGEIYGGKITNCSFSGVIKTTSASGGIVGSGRTSYIVKCKNYGNVYATGDSIGGISGFLDGYGLSSCINYGNIISTGNCIGGITSSLDIYSATDCKNYGSIQGNDYVAGIAPYLVKGSISGSSNYGFVTGNNYVGGISGYAKNGYSTSWHSAISRSFNSGTINGNDYVGGVAGYTTYGDVLKSVNIANVIGSTNVGALIGYSDSIWGKGEIADCHYFKSSSINYGLNGFGNSEDISGVCSFEQEDYFINWEKNNQ